MLLCSLTLSSSSLISSSFCPDSTTLAFEPLYSAHTNPTPLRAVTNRLRKKKGKEKQIKIMNVKEKCSSNLFSYCRNKNPIKMQVYFNKPAALLLHPHNINNNIATHPIIVCAFILIEICTNSTHKKRKRNSTVVPIPFKCENWLWF